ncbi:hypothetical protein [Aestuariivirga sp.]|uniref:hypothetical protein n=1 Tax=Aestuariivirga sp. TaxID=2650926 RepID=UPI0035AE442C
MNRRLVALSAVAAMLGGYLIFQGLDQSPSGGGDDAPKAVAVPALTDAVKLNPLKGLDPSAFTAIVEHPLFNPSRQPRPQEPVAAPQPPQVEQPPPVLPPPEPAGPGPDDYKLLGVSSGPDGRIAALRVASSGDVVYVRKGESVDNWSIVDVGDRSVAIGTADNPVTYELFASVDQGEGVSPAPQPGRQTQPLPLPLPMPQPAKPPGMPEQHTIPDTGG